MSTQTELPQTTKLHQKLLFNFLILVTLLLGLSTGFLLYERSKIAPENLAYLKAKNEIISIIKADSLKDLPDQDQQHKGELAGLVNSLEDPYSQYLDSKESEKFQDSLNQRYQGIGVRFSLVEERILVDRVFENSPAAESGIILGDVLTEVEGESTKGKSISQVAEKIRGPENTQIRLTFQRNDKESEYNLTRRRIQSDLIYLEIKDKNAIIEITSFGENLDQKMNQIAKEIKENSEIKNIVIDLRSNSGGYLDQAVEIMSHFLGPNEVAVLEKGKFGQESIRTKPKDVILDGYPVTILVNQDTASASEILAGGLKDGIGARLIGQKTFGKGVVQRVYNLKNGDQLKVTIAEWLTPNGQVINEKGLEPDILIDENQDIKAEALKLLEN